MMKTKLCIAALALLALAACGGGGGDDTPNAPDDTVPASALASLTSFTDWLGKQMANEGNEPLMMNSASPPTSDSDEPTDPN
jgi:ABC-type glycerol-3-phosphate transport system substrate-binding protein